MKLINYTQEEAYIIKCLSMNTREYWISKFKEMKSKYEFTLAYYATAQDDEFESLGVELHNANKQIQKLEGYIKTLEEGDEL